MAYYVAGIDLGSTAVRAVVQKVVENKSPEIIARTEVSVESGIFYRGNINNIEKLQGCVDKALQEAEAMAGLEIEEAFVGISSPNVRGMNTQGRVMVQGKHALVTQEDIERVQEAATPKELPPKYVPLTIIPYYYDLDGQKMVNPPLGMKGTDLTLVGYALIAPEGILNNIQISCSHRGLRVLSLIFEPLAGMFASVLPDCWDRGVLYIDLGHDTTEVVVGHKQGIVYSRVLAVGGKLFTTDLSTCLNLSSFEEAEKIKINHGNVLTDEVDPDKAVQLYSASPQASKVVSEVKISQILHARAEEIFQLILRELETQNLLSKCQRGYLAGGGAKLRGVLDLAAATFPFPMDMATAYGYQGLTDKIEEPSWMTALGLVRMGQQLYPTIRKPRRSFLSFFRRLFTKH